MTMQPIGKTYSMLQRLPDFYNPSDSSTLLARVLSVLAERLDDVERESYDILRAHHFPTAGNQHSQGYLGSPLSQRGDLDKILALYLEAVGGTSQLVEMNFRLRLSSINPRRLARALAHPTSPSLLYLWEQFQPDAQERILRYAPSYAHFKAEDIPSFIQNLALDPTPLGQQVRRRLAPQTLQLLSNYSPHNILSDLLRETLLAEANQKLLNDPNLLKDNFEVFAQLEWEKSIWPRIYALYPELIRKQYQKILDKNPKDFVAQRHLEALKHAEALDSIAAAEERVRFNRQFLQTARPNAASPIRIPTLNEIERTLLHELNQIIETQDLSQQEAFISLVGDLEGLREVYAEEPLALNHTLLHIALPYAIQDLYAPYRKRMGALIDLLRSKPSTHSGIRSIVAANLGIFGNHSRAREARQQIEIEEFLPQQKNLVSKSLHLFETFEVEQPSPIQKAPQFRLRLLEGSLQRLSNARIIDETTGASIRYNGILKVKDELTFEGNKAWLNSQPVSEVEGSLPSLQSSRSRFRFEADGSADAYAFLPFSRFDAAGSYFDRSLFVEPQWPSMCFDKQPYDEAIFTEPETPILGFDVESFDELYFDKAKDPSSDDAPNPALLNNESLAWIRFDHPTASFDKTLLAKKYPLVQLEVRTYDYTPGTFTLTIPWHLPGYTDQFAETKKHPRHFIQHLVDRVKASGTYAYIAYRQSFKEEQGLEDQLKCAIQSNNDQEGHFSQEHPAEDHLHSDNRHGGMEIHALDDALCLGGVFDYTSFDSLNTFE